MCKLVFYLILSWIIADGHDFVRVITYCSPGLAATHNLWPSILSNFEHEYLIFIYVNIVVVLSAGVLVQMWTRALAGW